MGVDNLWTLVAPRGRRLKLQAMQDKVIAIDASVWMYQFFKTLRDAETGAPLRGSHVLGFFRRICRLLILRIKPIFVFDGPPPLLKLATLRARKDERMAIERKTKQIAERLVRNRLTQKILRDPQPAEDESSVYSEIISESEDVDEVYDLEGDPLVTPRDLRLSVPAAFRGFVADRRAPDEIMANLEQESTRKVSVSSMRSQAIDLKPLSSLPARDEYRELLRMQSGLLVEGRRWALGQSAGEDLTDFSTSQTQAFLQLANVAEQISLSRKRLAQEEDLKRAQHISTTYVPPENITNKNKKGKVEWNMPTEAKSASFNTTALSRDQLLFAPINETKEVKIECDFHISDSDEEPVNVAALFGFGDVKIHTDHQPPIPRQETFPLPTQSQPTETQPTQTHIHQITHVDLTSSVESEALSETSDQTDDLIMSEKSITASLIEKEEEEPEQESEPDSDSVVNVSSSAESISDASDHLETIESPEQTHEPTIDFVRAVDESIKDPDIEEIDRLLSMENDVFGSKDRMIADLEREEQLLAEDMRRNLGESEEMDHAKMQADIRELLGAFGIPWIDAPAEAEAQCCFLAKNGMADGVVSDDSDCLVFGAPVVFRHLYFGEATVQMFSQSTIGFNQQQLISLAMLLGCDYTPGVHGIGIVNASEIVKVYKGFQGLAKLYMWATRRLVEKPGEEANPLENEEDSLELRSFKNTHKQYRSLWHFPPGFPSQEVWYALERPLVDTSEEPFSWAEPDAESVVDVLKRRAGLSEAKVMELLGPTLKRYAETKIQRRITDYFQAVFDCGSVGEFVSSRLQNATSSL